MSDIFVSYASGDLARVRPLVEALEREGWDVWWDRELHAGPRFDQAIEDAVDAARCIVVLWSVDSVASDWVRTEANEGLDRDILAPALLDEVRPPLAFRRSQTANLAGWPANADGFAGLVDGIREILGEPERRDNHVKRQEGGGASIAVLPFVNMSGDPEQEYFADGLSEDLIDRLVKVRDLRVVARTSSFQFKGKTNDVREIGSRLGVTHLVEGSVRRAGDRIRITAQLVRVDDGSHDWSERYDRNIGDVFALQDEITEKIASQLSEILTPPTRTHQPSPQALDHLLRGRSVSHRLTVRAMREARAEFQLAIDADPAFALAHAEAGYALMTEFSFSGGANLDLLDRSEAHTVRALALEPELLEARLNRARLLLDAEYRLQDALDEMRALYAEAPGSSAVLYTYLRLLSYVGRDHVSRPFAEKIRDIDPYSVQGHFWMIGLLRNDGAWADCNRELEIALAIAPENRTLREMAAGSFAQQGLHERALGVLSKRDIEISPLSAMVMASLGYPEHVHNYIETWRDRPGGRVYLAHMYAWLGEYESCLEALQGAVDAKDPQLWHVSSLAEDARVPMLEVRTAYARPEAQALLAQVGLDWESIRKVRV